eukprot:3151000-Rhodomonas_salina.1
MGGLEQNFEQESTVGAVCEKGPKRIPHVEWEVRSERHRLEPLECVSSEHQHNTRAEQRSDLRNGSGKRRGAHERDAWQRVRGCVLHSLATPALSEPDRA